MAVKRRISDGATFEDAQALLLKATRQLRTLMADGADVGPLDQIEAQMAWQASLDAWIAANPKRRGAIFWGSYRFHRDCGESQRAPAGFLKRRAAALIKAGTDQSQTPVMTTSA
jgi:hypothetical protein